MSDAALREPWSDLRMQREGVGLGMWIFLAGEVLFFGGLFVSYAVYRSFQRRRVPLGERAYANPLRLDQHRFVAHFEPHDDDCAAGRNGGAALV